MTYNELAKKLTELWNQHTKGTGLEHTPSHLFVGQAVYDVFCSGITAVRYSNDTGELSTGNPAGVLLFKSTKMELVKSLGPWEIVLGKKITLE